MTELPAKKSYRKVQVWIHSGERVLLLKMIPDRGGFWQPVTGSVEPDESIEDGALREAVEETGLSFQGAPVFLNYEFECRWGHARESAVALSAPEGQPRVKLDSTEHEAFRWVSPEEAMATLHFESNRKALQCLLQKGLMPS